MSITVQNKALGILVLIAILLLSMVGCSKPEGSMTEPTAGQSSAAKAEEAPTADRPAAKSEGEAGGARADSAPSPAAPRLSSPPSGAAGEEAKAAAPPPPSEVAAEPVAGRGDVAERRPEPRVEPQQGQPAAGKLTAGRWRDLDHWDFWSQLMDRGQGGALHAQNADRWGFNTQGLVRVEVVGPAGPAVDAPVQLLNAQQQVIWQTRTDKKGQASLFAGLFKPEAGPYVVLAGAGAQAKTFNVRAPDPLETIRVQLSEAVPPANVLDVMFVVDTTGSMGDELNYLKSELQSVITQVQQRHGQQLRVRTSVNFYRDTTDAYTVLPFPFSEELERSVQALREQSAGGGGDFPEAVDAALVDAVDRHAWSGSARARLLFLVLDAPPHSDAQVVQQVQEVTRRAAAQGIRVIPVAGSGIDKPTEFLMRFLAISTHGDYIFLTDHSGIGGGHIKPTIGPHTVEQLNDLLVRVIHEQL